MSGPEGIFSEIVSSFYYEAYSGREWARVYFDDWGNLTLTHDFLNLPLDERNEIFNLLQDALVTNPNAAPWELDNLLLSGSEGSVHTLGQRYVVKTVGSRPFRSEDDIWENRLKYMSMLRDIVRAEFPDWVDMVPNLLLYEDSEMNNYVVMPRIGEGITIIDLERYVRGQRLRNPNLYDAIQSEFPGFDVNNFEDLRDQSYLLDELINTMYSNHPKLPKLPDYKWINLIVTNSDYGTNGYPYKIWFIDQ